MQKGEKFPSPEMLPEYPATICEACGRKYGKRTPIIATWYHGACGWCGTLGAVTEPRDFGYPNPPWTRPI